jgi:hypothetical protein
MNLHFILCLERTGSSMLATMLNCSNELISPSEEPFLLYFNKKYGKTTFWSDEKLINFAEEFFLLHDKNLKVYFNTKEQLIENLLKINRNSPFLEVCKIVYLNFYPEMDKINVQTIIDKQIKYSYRPNDIASICPEAKFIVLTRNPLDNLASWRKRELGAIQDATFLSEIWRDLYSILFKFSQKNSEKVLHLKYEDLVSSPEESLKRICSFLAIEYKESMLLFNEHFNQFTETSIQKDPKFTDRLNNFHSGLHKQVNSENIDIYNKFFSKEEVDLICSNCKDVANEFGYQLPEFELKSDSALSFKKIRSRWRRRHILNIYFHTPFWLKKFLRNMRPKTVDA